MKNLIIYKIVMLIPISVLFLLLIFIPNISHLQSFAQTNKDTNTTGLDFYTLAQVVGLSAIIGSIFTMLLNFVYEYFKLKNERQRKFLEDKLSLCAAFIFYLERMLENPDFATGDEESYKIAETIQDIDSLLKEKLYLFGHNEFSLWLDFRNKYQDI